MKLIVGLFESLAEAEATRRELSSAGFDEGNTTLIAPEGSAGAESAPGLAESSAAYNDGGTLSRLEGLGVPSSDARIYAEGVRRNGAVIALRAPADKVDHALEIMDRQGSLDVDDKLTSWRSEGFVHEDEGQTAARTTTTGEDGVIEVAEEQLRVGKRSVDQGGVRVRSRIIETPVQEQVELRDETIHVDRRPVDRAAGADAFKEGTVEIHETDEEAVVDKSARVVEEIAVGKDVEVHTETVEDTVRRTEVDVDKISADEKRRR